MDNNADLSSYVVALNQLVTELNKNARKTFQPDVEEITRIASEIKSNAEMILERIKS